MEWIDKNYWNNFGNKFGIVIVFTEDQDYFKEQIGKNSPNDYFFKTVKY